MNMTMPAGAMAPFSINNQPLSGGIINGLSWEDVALAYWHQQNAFPTIVDATGQTIEYFPPSDEYPKGYFNFTAGDRDHAGYSDQFDQGGYYVG